MPVTTGAGMNVAPFGPGDLSGLFERLNEAVRWRFGMRRAWSNWLVRRRFARSAENLKEFLTSAPDVDLDISRSALPAGRIDMG